MSLGCPELNKKNQYQRGCMLETGQREEKIWSLSVSASGLTNMVTPSERGQQNGSGRSPEEDKSLVESA